MPTKRLRSQTIIPPTLYVDRGADTQLQQVVSDMGRPGYVLVARQMGKTNLLLNARRLLSHSENCFVYVDLSNQFPTVQSFLRNIIDVAVDSLPVPSENVKEKIRHERLAQANSLPHKEHEQELRQLLREMKGKMVICLDEIDALTKTDYSDQVFSLIRSMYFAGRVNFAEFSRLTYVLSGVAEPSEIIKNRDVSPFNIGEKIYLNDFTRAEFDVFLRKAALELNPVVEDRIYFWTNGNPRMTWDLTSAVEDMIFSGVGPTIQDVDHLVYQMYFVKFDLPPVDHIRTLAFDDSEIRDALMAIQYGKGSSISDAMRSKLYLAGIIALSESSKDIAIRNRILEETLSEKWLQEVERAKHTLLEFAHKKFDDSDYAAARDLYRQYLNESANPEDARFAEYRLGSCLVQTGEYLDAISVLKKIPITKAASSSAYYNEMYWLGLSHLVTEKYEESIGYFQNVLEQDPASKDTVNYFDACLNLSTAYLRVPGKNSSEIERLNLLVLDEASRLSDGAKGDESANKYRCVAHFNLCRLYKQEKNTEKAIRHIVQAVMLADVRSKPALLIEQHDLAATISERQSLLAEAVDIISRNGLAVVEKNKEHPFDFSHENCVAIFVGIARCNDMENLRRLANYLVEESTSDKAGVFDAIAQAGYLSTTRTNVQAAVLLFRLALGFEGLRGNTLDRRQIMTIAMLVSPFAEVATLEAQYVTEFLAPADARFLQTDFRLIYGLVTGHLEEGNVDRARELVQLGHGVLVKNARLGVSEISGFFHFGLVMFNFLRLQIDVDSGNLQAKVELGIELRKQLESLPNDVPAYFPVDFVKQIRRVARDIVQDKILRKAPVRRGLNKIGRNQIVAVKFKNGTVQRGKYKVFEQSIKAGICEIVDT